MRNFSDKYRKQLLDIGLSALKTGFKKVVHEAAEGTGEFIGNKIVDTVAKSKDNNILKTKPVIDENSRKKRRNIKQIKRSIIKMEHYKIAKQLNDSSVLTFVTNKWIEINNLSSSQYSVNKI